MRTPARGWAVLLLFRAQGSSVILISYIFGLFLPLIARTWTFRCWRRGCFRRVGGWRRPPPCWHSERGSLVSDQGQRHWYSWVLAFGSCSYKPWQPVLSF